MDNLIQKFYSNGKEEEQKYTQFGAFSNSLMKNSGLKFIKPNIGLVNPAIHNMENTSTKLQPPPQQLTQIIPKTPNKTVISNDTYLHPKKLIFNSSSDLFNQTIPKNNFAYSSKNDNDLNLNQEPIPSLQTMKQKANIENKKNSTKMQMMEEKMKNLELKSQRLEVINDFFFDMFENNLVKEELKRQRGIKQEKNEKNEEDNISNENSEWPNVENIPRKKKHRKKKKEIIINPKEITDEETFKNEFIKKTDNISKNYLSNIKNQIGILLVEQQLNKNETLNNMTEDILDLKGDLLNKLEQMEMKQKAEMKTIAFCLQNSGDEKIESLANRLFGDNILRPDEDILNYNSDKNSMNTTGLKFTGTAFNNTNLFKTNIIKKKSKDEKRRSSIETNNEDNPRIRRKSTYMDTEQNVIMEDKDE